MNESCPIKIYFDEDSMNNDLVRALRSRGVTAMTALAADLTNRPDEEHLVFAAGHGFVLYTFNTSDFQRLHSQWLASGRQHSGIIAGQQQRYSVGEQLRRILRLGAAMTAIGMHNRMEFLGNWPDDASNV